jgi:transcriptional regulator with XRE-family HTH domain
MECQIDPAGVLRETRVEHGLSQRRLAVRAGTSQDAISRIERGVESPSLERLAQILLAMGERLVLNVEPLQSPVPLVELDAAATMSPSERLREAASWNRVASQLALAGKDARRVGHPAMRRGGT